MQTLEKGLVDRDTVSINYCHHEIFIPGNCVLLCRSLSQEKGTIRQAEHLNGHFPFESTVSCFASPHSSIVSHWSGLMVWVSL